MWAVTIIGTKSCAKRVFANYPAAHFDRFRMLETSHLWPYFAKKTAEQVGRDGKSWVVLHSQTPSKLSGKGVASLSPPPLRSVHESFPSHGSSKPVTDGLPQMARPLMADVLALFAALLAASNIHQDKPSSLSSMAGSPVARQHPFGLGISPIQQVMGSLYLSAAGLRFLQHPVPAEELALPCGRVAGHKARPQRGYPVPHP